MNYCNEIIMIGEYEARDEEEGRRFNLATRVMSNGVEVIVAGPTPALRWENSNPQPTLTLSDTVVMLLPQDKLNEFVTKTCTTTFTYLSTITKDGMTTVSTEQQVFMPIYFVEQSYNFYYKENLLIKIDYNRNIL